MSKKGEFNIPINIAVQIVTGFNFLLAFFSPIVIEKFSQRKSLISG